MNKLAVSIIGGALFASLAIAGTITAPANAAEGEDAIKQRIELMKTGVLKNYLPIKKFIDSGEGTAASVADHAKKLNAASKEVLALFPKGTGRGDFDDKTTRALPKIWEDWAGFEKSTEFFIVETAKLAEVAESGDADAIKAQFGKMAKGSCGGCHKDFRGAKAK